MKQALFLLAIYALILNQVRKDEKEAIPPKPGPTPFQFALAGSSGQYHIEKFRYFDQAVFLVTSAENKQRMIVFEDGTVMDVLDESTQDHSPNAYRFTSAAITPGTSKR
jgi:hypothetical protein